VVKDAVFPTISVSNPVLADLTTKGLTQEMFIKIYITGEIKTWGEALVDLKLPMKSMFSLAPTLAGQQKPGRNI
jgi:hypothetical protein